MREGAGLQDSCPVRHSIRRQHTQNTQRTTRNIHNATDAGLALLFLLLTSLWYFLPSKLCGTLSSFMYIYLYVRVGHHPAKSRLPWFADCYPNPDPNPH
jgi:hypothetical protein